MSVVLEDFGKLLPYTLPYSLDGGPSDLVSWNALDYSSGLAEER